MSHLKYSRKTKVVKKDENGIAIPLTVKETLPDGSKTEGDIIPGQFETEEKIVYDTMNLDNVIRSVSVGDNKILVLLNDGHESTEKQPMLINPKKGYVQGNVKEEKTRVWLQSEIELEGEDIKNFYLALGV